ncbi:RICIN domain-containing protein [Micromonospora sp. LOL_024]|uniref:RICIN domain-containing protein n=1 Tax=Micromonospora sp. LOL_024 TaxID=3345412 RepID=UPI003A83F2F0
MWPEPHLDESLRTVARHGVQGRVPPAADIRRRGDSRRRRRQAVCAGLGALLVGVLGAGAVLVRLSGASDGGPVGLTPGPAAASPGPSGTTAGPPISDPVLSGQRQVTVVRAAEQAGGLSLLDDGRLTEVDGDEGRQLFVFVPQAAGTYLIRAVAQGLTDACWEVRSAGSDPLRVAAAACLPDEPRQQFSVVRDGQRDGEPTYAISNYSAYLQDSPTRGLILEELGDANLTTHFRLVDNGAAPG